MQHDTNNETLNFEENQEYQPKPRKSPRIPNIDLNAVDERIKELTQILLKHVDESDYRNIEFYIQRANLRFAAGDDLVLALDDLFLAAKCLHNRHAMHLELKPPEMFITRRVTPVELAITSGMPMLTMEISATYGLPLMMILAKSAPEDILSEAYLLSSFFRRDFCPDFYELAGLSATTYAGVIAAMGRGFDDEAILGLNTYAKARDSLRGEPPKSALSKLKRYDGLCTALSAICHGQFEIIPQILSDLVDEFIQDNKSTIGEDEYLKPYRTPVPKYFDLSILTILALLALREKLMPMPEIGNIAHYNDFIDAFTNLPDRTLEMQEIDAETREILQQAGINPDAIQSQVMQDTVQQKKEEAEARALEILMERQRAAQQAVKEKLALQAQQPISEEDIVQPEKINITQLKLTEDENDKGNAQTQTSSSTYANFFDNIDENAIPKIDDEQLNLTQTNTSKTFDKSFFDRQTVHETDLKLYDDTPSNPPLPTPQQQTDQKIDEEHYLSESRPKSQYDAFFDEEYKPSFQLKMSDTPLNENQSQDTPRPNPELEKIKKLREEQIKELQELQAEKTKQQKENYTLQLDKEVEAPQQIKPQSREDKIQNILEEKNRLAREAALEEREKTQQEIQNYTPEKIQPQTLKLKADPSHEEEENIIVKQPEDLQISPYAYTELDRIHDNTALREELPEDLTVQHLISHETTNHDVQNNNPKQDEKNEDDNLIVNIDY